MAVDMKKLCVFYRLADRFLGNEKIEWIVCKECQRRLVAGIGLEVVWQKVHKPKTVLERSKSEIDYHLRYGVWPEERTEEILDKIISERDALYARVRKTILERHPVDIALDALAARTNGDRAKRCTGECNKCSGPFADSA